MMAFCFIIAAVLFETAQSGIELKVESETTVIDPAKSVFLRVELKAAPDRTATLPDLRDRAVGFALAEDFVEEPQQLPDGTKVQVANWRLVPEPCAEVYKLKPFVVKGSPKIFKAQSDEGRHSLIGGPIYFEGPAAREPVTGAMEAEPEKDFPPLSWKLVLVALGLVLGAAAVALIWLGGKYIARRIREHRMSPIERAWVELDRLLKKGLPGRGRYKDFYVELTMVVRRYIQRKYGVRAPQLTTEEFFAELRNSNTQTLDNSSILRKFLESADMVKFAGVEATPEMADEATDSARAYLNDDSKAAAGRTPGVGGGQS